MTESTNSSAGKPEMDKKVVPIIGPMDNNEVKLASINLFNEAESDKFAEDFLSSVINPILSSMNFRNQQADLK